MTQERPYIALEDLYIAYRKAKVEAFHENTHFHAEAFTIYEQDLASNLSELFARINDADASWTSDIQFLGRYDYAPKSVEEPRLEEDGHFRDLDPIEDWKRRAHAAKHRSDANFRLLIIPTVDFQVLSALWILKVGHRYDRCLDQHLSYGNRLRLATDPTNVEELPDPGLNIDCQGLFKPYFSAYRLWRERGLNAMRAAIESNTPAVAVTMDIRQFYHRVSPSFLTRRVFIDRLGLQLSRADVRFTKRLVSAIQYWYSNTPDYEDRPEGGLPVGLSASKIISNVLLVEFDRLLVQEFHPLYYGRYVDDVFLVLRLGKHRIESGLDLMKILANRSGGLLRFVNAREYGPSLRIVLPYAKDSDLVFVGKKQKVFLLTSRHGLDLIEQISNQIRAQSSEHRLLPDLPETDVEMADRALLAVPDTTLESDSLRKTESVSIRRLGFSLLLRDVEAFGRDLRASRWRKLRQQFYGLVSRHLLSPKGFFDYAGYLHRVFGLMISCRDYEDAHEFIRRFSSVSGLIRDTTNAGTSQKSRFNLAIEHYVRGFVQAALQASTSKYFRFDAEFMRIVRLLKVTAPGVRVPASLKSATSFSDKMLLADWGRRPYKDYWYFDQRANIAGPSVPKEIGVRRIIRVGGIRPFRRSASLHVPHWPALAFATRPLSIAEITLIAPLLLDDQYRLRRAVLSLRGARVHSAADIGATAQKGELYVRVPSPSAKIRVALTNIETTEAQWEAAATLRPDLSLNRYLRLHRLMNQVMKDPSMPTYVALPECSIPKRWALSIAAKLSQSGISFLAGLEYQRTLKDPHLRNDCLVSLATRWPYYQTNVLWVQPKLEPAHNEKTYLKRLGKALYLPRGRDNILPVYVHGDFHFGVLICSDLTNIENRRFFQGKLDALFVLEWNRDVNTFSFLVESSAHDVHAFVVQINNRMYGDSRVRTPIESSYLRDMVRLKGGIADYYVIADIDYSALREFQASDGKGKVFKPLPIGFKMSESRKGALS